MTINADTARQVDVVVIGGGLAGLATAAELVRSGAEVTVIEARAQVGGRSRTLTVPSGPGRAGTEIDLGAQWVSRDQPRVLALARQLGLSTIRSSARGVSVTEIDGRLLRSRSSFPLPSAGVVGDLAVCIARLSWITRRIPLDAPWTTPAAERLDSASFADWLEQVCRRDMTRRILRGLVEGGICASADHVSLLEVAHQLSSLGGWGALSSADSLWFPGGSQGLSIGLARRLGSRVLVGSRVLSIHMDTTGVDVTLPDRVLRARRVVLAVPPQVVAAMGFDPPLPAERQAALADRVRGSITKTVIGYHHAWWRERGLDGTASPEVGPIDLLNDVSLHDAHPGVLVALSTGERTQQLDPQRPGHAARVHEVVERMFGPAPSPPLFVETLEWDNEPTALGGYASRFGVGGWIRHGPHWRSPVGRLHFAGTETASTWRSYMEGALDSAARVAVEVAVALAARSDTPVNTRKG